MVRYRHLPSRLPLHLRGHAGAPQTGVRAALRREHRRAGRKHAARDPHKPHARRWRPQGHPRAGLHGRRRRRSRRRRHETTAPAGRLPEGDHRGGPREHPARIYGELVSRAVKGGPVARCCSVGHNILWVVWRRRLRMGRAVSLVGAVFALVCVVLVLLVVPAGAQDGGIHLPTAADGSNPENPSDNPTIITIAARGCTVAAGASITLEDGDGTRAVFTDGDRGITIISQDGHPRIEGPPGDFVGDHARFPGSDKSFDTDGDYSVVSSTGVTDCEGGTAPVDDQYDPGDVDDPGGTVPDTASRTGMPDTGGPPYLALGALLFLGAALLVGRGVLRS